MKAAEALRLAEQAGIDIVVDRGYLRMRAKQAPPTQVVDALRQHKVEIIALLASAGSDRSADFFQADGEAGVFEKRIVDWLNRNSEPSTARQCAWCGGQQTRGAVVVPYGSRDRHTWLHPRCWAVWHQYRRAKAAHAVTHSGN